MEDVLKGYSSDKDMLIQDAIHEAISKVEEAYGVKVVIDYWDYVDEGGD